MAFTVTDNKVGPQVAQLSSLCSIRSTTSPPPSPRGLDTPAQSLHPAMF